MSAKSAALAAGLNPIESERLALGCAEHTVTKVPSAVRQDAQDVTCARCTTSFSCGANTSYCWCQKLPTLDLSLRSADLLERGCLCLRCLRAAVSAQTAA